MSSISRVSYIAYFLCKQTVSEFDYCPPTSTLTLISKTLLALLAGMTMTSSQTLTHPLKLELSPQSDESHRRCTAPRRSHLQMMHNILYMFR